jgi:hypothetical protein
MRSVRVSSPGLALSSFRAVTAARMPLARAFSGTGSDADFAPIKKVPPGIAEAQAKIQADITSNDVFLYMKVILQPYQPY